VLVDVEDLFRLARLNQYHLPLVSSTIPMLVESPPNP
jgi:hypothetical protein